MSDTAQQALQNLRDVGGPTVGNMRVRRGVLYRSEAPLPGDEDPQRLAWPPATVLDLRAEGEARVAHPLESDGTRIIAFPLDQALRPGELMTREAPADLSELYLTTIRNAAPRFAAAIDIIADAPAPILIHCAAGKDRTGLLVAVVLAAIGVDRPEIVADYCATSAVMDGVVQRSLLGSDEARRGSVTRYRETSPHMFDAPAHAIEAALDEIGGSPAAVTVWLRENGLSEATLVRLHQRLLEPVV